MKKKTESIKGQKPTPAEQQWSAAKIIHKNPADLIPYARNSRTHSEQQIAQIAASIKEWGFTTPILLDESNQIIAGHGRTLGALLLKMPKVPCIVAEGWTTAQKKAYVIADNKLALNAGWDNEMLKLELGELGDLDFDLALTGFSLDELEVFKDSGTEGLTEPDDVPEVGKLPVSVAGDIWLLGKHRLLCGDATKIDDVQKVVAGASVDMLLTDPPYNVEYEGKTKNKLKIKNDKQSTGDFLQFLSDAFSNVKTVMKPGAVFYIWYADVESYNFMAALRACDLQLRQVLIWQKNQIIMGRKDYHFKHEPCLYGWKDGAAHLWASDRKQTTIMNFDKPQRSDVHPTMKPVALLEYQLLNNTKGEDIILDPFLGSGSTMIAAEKSGRICYGVELDPKYCDVIIKRWQMFTGNQAVNEASGKTYSELAGE